MLDDVGSRWACQWMKSPSTTPGGHLSQRGGLFTKLSVLVDSECWDCYFQDLVVLRNKIYVNGVIKYFSWLFSMSSSKKSSEKYQLPSQAKNSIWRTCIGAVVLMPWRWKDGEIFFSKASQAINILTIATTLPGGVLNSTIQSRLIISSADKK